MGVTLQLWENGDHKGQSVLINLLLVKAPRNVMLVSLRRDYESCGTEFSGRVKSVISSPGDDLKSREVPSFLRQAIEVLQIPEADSEKSRPVGLNEDLVLEPSCAFPFFAKVMRRTWFASVKSSPETLLE